MHGQVRIWHMSDDEGQLCPGVYPYILLLTDVYWKVGDNSPHPLGLGYEAYVNTLDRDLWPLTELTGTTIHDHVTNGINGTISGSYTLGITDGPLSNQITHSVSLTGGHIRVVDPGYFRWANGLSYPCSCNFFVKWAGAGVEQIPIHIADGTGTAGAEMIVTLQVNGKVRLDTWAATVISTHTVNDNHWHMITATYQQTGGPVGQMAIYIDSIFEAATVLPEIEYGPVAPPDFFIGSDLLGAHPYTGLISEVTWFDLSLYGPDVLAIWQAAQNIPSIQPYHTLSPAGFFYGDIHYSPSDYWYARTFNDGGDEAMYYDGAHYWLVGGVLVNTAADLTNQNNAPYLAGYFDRNQHIFVPRWSISWPPAVPDRFSPILTGGMRSACSDGGVGMYALAMIQDSSAELTTGIVVHWDGSSTTASSQLPNPYPNTINNWVGNFWVRITYATSSNPYALFPLYNQPNFNLHHPSPPAGWNGYDYQTLSLYSIFRYSGQTYGLARGTQNYQTGPSSFMNLGYTVLMRAAGNADNPDNWSMLHITSPYDLNISAWGDYGRPYQIHSPGDYFSRGRIWKIEYHSNVYVSLGTTLDAQYGYTPPDLALIRRVGATSTSVSFVLPGPRLGYAQSWGGMMTIIHDTLYLLTMECGNDPTPNNPVALRLWRLADEVNNIWSQVSEFHLVAGNLSSLNMAQMSNDGGDYIAIIMESMTDTASVFLITWHYEALNGPGTWYNCAVGTIALPVRDGAVRNHMWFE